MTIATLNPGTAVDWRPHPQSQPIRTSIRSVETIRRNSGELLQLAALECNRLVPVSELEPIIGDAIKSPELPPKSPELPPARVPAANITQPARIITETAPAITKTAAAITEPPQSIPAACRILAIDFLNLLVRAFHAGKPSDVHAVRSLFQTVAAAVRALNPQHVIFAMDGGHDERTRLFPAYKAHRPPSEPLLTKQKQIAEQAIGIAGFQAIRVAGWEADDVLASLAQQFDGVVIASADKDLLALDGRARIFHPWNGGEFVTAAGKLGVPAGQVTDYLALCGDASDGVPGVSGIGPKTAVQLLEKYGSLESILAAAQLQHIPGAAGKKIKEQTPAALLSHKLIELRRTLPLPELADFRPRAGWPQLLQSLGLPGVVPLVENCVELIARRRENKTPPQRVALSASTGKDERAERAASGNPESPQQADGKRDPDRPLELTSATSGSPKDSAAQAPVGIQAAVSVSSRVFRSISEPLITKGRSVHENFSGPDGGLILCWESGQTAAPGSTCPWRAESPQSAAWHQGYRHEDLDVIHSPPQPLARPFSPGTPGEKVAVRPDEGAAAAAAEPKPPTTRQKSLF